MTADFLAGRRRPRASPLQLFLVCNLVFFIVQPLTGLNILAPPLASQVDQTYYSGIARTAAVRHVGAAVLASPAFHRRYYQLTTVQARSLVIVMVPLFAIILSVVEAGKGRLFVEHLVFALHLYGFFLLWLSSALVLTALLIRLTPGVATARFDTPLTIVEFGGVAIYSAVALRTAYGESLLMSFTRGVLLGFGSYCILFAYRFVLFFTTLYAA